MSKRIEINRLPDGPTNGPPSPLDRGSDRLYFDPRLPPAVITWANLDVLRELRKAGFLPGFPHSVIVNEHEEVSIDLSTRGSPLSLPRLKDVISPTSRDEYSPLTLSNRMTRVQFEGEKNILDLYVVSGGISQRLRLYIDGPSVKSTRIITVAAEAASRPLFRVFGQDVLARDECVFVEREDEQEGPYSLAKVEFNIDRFFTRHNGLGRRVTAAVYKRVIPLVILVNKPCGVIDWQSQTIVWEKGLI